MKPPNKLLPICLLCAVVWLAVPAPIRAQLSFTTNNGAITITGTAATNAAVVIPSATNGFPVVSIGPGAFYESSLIGVTIPASVTNIGDEAFYDCANLTNLTIPDSITSLGQEVFEDCTSLSQIDLGTNLASITSGLFENCYSLAGVSIPANVTSIGDNAFNYCYNMTAVTIGTNVTSIGQSAFFDCVSLNSLAIPDRVTNVEELAFGFCSSLTSVTIGAGVTSIGQSAFYDCGSVTNLTLGTNVASIGGEAFFSCTGLTSVTISGSVTNMGIYAFSACLRLTNVYFQGNAPGGPATVFAYDAHTTLYYLPGTLGWGTTFGGAPTWNPQVQTSDGGFGVQNDQFGFNITGNTNLVVVIQAATNLTNAVWSPVSTLTLTNGSGHFSDPLWEDYPGRFYRLSPP